MLTLFLPSWSLNWISLLIVLKHRTKKDLRSVAVHYGIVVHSNPKKEELHEIVVNTLIQQGVLVGKINLSSVQDTISAGASEQVSEGEEGERETGQQ